jgi:hypothetical protein
MITEGNKQKKQHDDPVLLLNHWMSISTIHNVQADLGEVLTIISLQGDLSF